MVAFARQRLTAGAPPLTAALEAGASRIRPVLMTAFAMIIGMIPMALGLGEGAEQNAPLGRAVIGGLLFATVSTLFFVPVVFAGIHTRLARRHRNDDGDQAGHGGGNGDEGDQSDQGKNGNSGNGNDHPDGPAPDHGGAPRPASS
jgi:predicted RND superfamily exporter protein